MSRLPQSPDITPTYLYNPTKADFKCLMAGEQNVQHEYVIPSRQIVSFPKYIADHVAKHLAQEIATETEGGLAYEYKYKAAMDKIIVTNL